MSCRLPPRDRTRATDRRSRPQGEVNLDETQQAGRELLAESYLTGTLFRQILARIERLEWHPSSTIDPRCPSAAKAAWGGHRGLMRGSATTCDEVGAH